MVVFTKRGYSQMKANEATPSPDRIREMTAAIRQNWSLRERRKRAGMAGCYVELLEMPLQTRRKGFWGEL